MLYKIFLNHGNENIGFEGDSISVQEVKTAISNDFVAKYIHNKNPLYSIEVMASAIEVLCNGLADLMAEGFDIQLTSKNNVCVRFYPDVKIKGGNINLDRAQELIPGTTELTKENAAELVRAAGLIVRAKAEVEQKLTEMMRASKPNAKIPLDLDEIKEVDKIIKNTSTGTDTSTGTVDTSTNANSSTGEGDDGLGG